LYISSFNLQEDCHENPLDDLSNKGAFSSGFSRNDGSMCIPSLRGTKQSPCTFRHSISRKIATNPPLMIFLIKEHFHQGFLAMTAQCAFHHCEARSNLLVHFVIQSSGRFHENPLDDLSNKGAFSSGFSRNDGSMCIPSLRGTKQSPCTFRHSISRKIATKTPLMIFLIKEHFHQGFLAMTARCVFRLCEA
jgi:hypothetical protein